MATKKIRTAVITAFLASLGEKGWEATTRAEIAERAGIPLSSLRDAYGSRLAILADFSAEIDQKVLADPDQDMQGEPARDRLFDVLIRRLELLEEYKPAIRALIDAARQDLTLAVRFNRLALRSMSWMLTAAGLEADGRRGALKTQGLVVGFAQVTTVWLDDDDPGLARTMATLDRMLDRGETALDRFDRLSQTTGTIKSAVRSAGRLMGGLMKKRSSRPKSAAQTDDMSTEDLADAH